MVAAFDFCAFGKGGAAPSIDTAMHGLVEAAHVDHLHPDAGIAFATAADGEKLTRECFGDRVAWVPWRRPGFQLGLDIAAIKREHPEAIGVILGGHGITAWGQTSDECEARSLEIIAAAQKFIDERGAARPFGKLVVEPLPETERRARAAALAPVIRGLASTDKPQLGHFTDSAVVLEFTGSERLPELAALGTSCPDHFLRTKVRPMVLDLPPDGAARGRGRAAARAARGLPGGVPGLLRAVRHPRLAADARRRPGDRAGAGRRHVQLRRRQADRPGRGGVLRQRDQRDARGGGDLGLRADPGEREVPDRVLGARGGQAAAAARAQAAGRADRAGDRRRLGDRPGDRAAAGGRGRLRGGRGPRRRVGGRGRRRARVGRRRGLGRRPT